MFRFLFTILVLPIVSLVVPINKNRYVFGAWFGRRFDDSPAAYIQHLSVSKPGIELVWIYRDGFVIPGDMPETIKFVRSGTLCAFMAQITACIVFVTHGLNADLDRCYVSHRSKRIQFWHGIPIKKIRFDSEKDNRYPARFIKFFGLRWILNEYYTAITACGPIDQAIFCSAFNVSPETVFITGLPRYECLANHLQCHRDQQKMSDTLKDLIISYNTL